MKWAIDNGVAGYQDHVPGAVRNVLRLKSTLRGAGWKQARR